MLQIKERVRYSVGGAWSGSGTICDRKTGGTIMKWTFLISNKVLRLYHYLFGCFIWTLILFHELGFKNIYIYKLIMKFNFYIAKKKKKKKFLEFSKII